MGKNEEELIDTSEEEDDQEEGSGPYATLASEGPKESTGSNGHPEQCTPCTFYCFTRRGCNRGADCKFCHMTHQSKLQQRREAWKKQQREKRKLMRGFAHKDETPVLVPEVSQRPGGKGRKVGVAEGQAKPATGVQGASSIRSVVFTYTPSRVTLTMGQQTQLRPALFGPAATRRFACLNRLPEGLSLDPMTGTVSGTPISGSPWEVYTIQVEMMDGQTAQTGLEIEVVDFTRGGFVVGHISEVAPGRFMLVVYKPDEADAGPNRGKEQNGGVALQDLQACKYP
mmetsp:Transcript_66722/g.157113  ORF Transcript_66722/g.157113 Transcript_66722/m.157113 type:complete len:284 (-) Transcript_66722:72-923(-)